MVPFQDSDAQGLLTKPEQQPGEKTKAAWPLNQRTQSFEVSPAPGLRGKPAAADDARAERARGWAAS